MDGVDEERAESRMMSGMGAPAALFVQGASCRFRSTSREQTGAEPVGIEGCGRIILQAQIHKTFIDNRQRQHIALCLIDADLRQLPHALMGLRLNNVARLMLSLDRLTRGLGLLFTHAPGVDGEALTARIGCHRETLQLLAHFGL